MAKLKPSIVTISGKHRGDVYVDSKNILHMFASLLNRVLKKRARIQGAIHPGEVFESIGLEARDWFFNSIESRFVRHYKFCVCDNGTEEIV